MTGVLPEELEAVWPLVAGLLAEVCTRSRGKESLVELRAALGAGHKQLWVWCADAGVQALAVTDIAVYPAARICRICFCWTALASLPVWYTRISAISPGTSRMTTKMRMDAPTSVGTNSSRRRAT